MGMARVRRLAAAALALCLLSAGALARTLPLPDGLVALNSEAGETLLLHSTARQAYWDLSLQFVTQKTQTYCGIASIVMVLNAVGVPAPTTPELEPYRIFTQDNFFNDETEKILPQAVVARQGMTLDEIGRLVQSYGVHAEIHHAGDTTLDEFRRLASEHLARPDRHVIVNYLRWSIGQESGGHISPLAAYNAEADEFLILDVARYKYPPVWVKAAALFDAMNTADPDNGNRTRGFALIDAGR